MRRYISVLDVPPRCKHRSYLKILSILGIIAILVSFSFIPTLPSVLAEDNRVYSITIEGNIDGGTATHVESAISKAEQEERPLIIKIDTPGGLLHSTEEIVNEIQRTDIEVVTWITPRGAWGYSAGAFITLAGDIALMNNQTSIGSAEPQPSDNKTIQAMASWIEEIAEGQDRNGTAARRFVTENLNIGVEDAIDLDLIDARAEDEDDVLEKLDIEDAVFEEIDKSFTDQMISLLTNPTVVFLLLLLGILGLVTEITTGGVGVPGIGGGIALILAFYGLRILELSTIGVFLIVLGIILLIAEYFEPGFGVFGIGGAISLFLGILFVGEEPYIEVSSDVLMGLVVVLLGGSLFVIWSVRRALKKEVETGMETMKGMKGKVTKTLDPDGVVKVKGERWIATSNDLIEEGDSVMIKDIIEKDGQTTLLVERDSSDDV